MILCKFLFTFRTLIQKSFFFLFFFRFSFYYPLLQRHRGCLHFYFYFAFFASVSVYDISFLYVEANLLGCLVSVYGDEVVCGKICPGCNITHNVFLCT